MVASPGLANGMAIVHQIRKNPAPSIFAASSRSVGIPLKNWRSKKI